MRMGVHSEQLAPSLAEADAVFLYNPPDLHWDVSDVAKAVGAKAQAVSDIAALVQAVAALARPGDHVLIMSNGAFGGIHDKLTEALKP
jgi:UDP-N-acetylmuramate: L-alanyl-gamma-D-glutamyl-meso-diaminopimelate ligase